MTDAMVVTPSRLVTDGLLLGFRVGEGVFYQPTSGEGDDIRGKDYLHL